MRRRAKEDVHHTELICKAWQDSGKVYGYRKLHDDLLDQGESCCPNGIADGSVAPCETACVVNLLLVMLIWFGKWVPSFEDITVSRMMDAIRVFTLRGLNAPTGAS